MRLVIRGILRISIILGLVLRGNNICAQTSRSSQATLVIQVDPTLTLIAPEPMNYTLIDPLTAGCESVVLGQQVVLKGNYFNNMVDQPYISVSITETQPNVILKLTNIKIATDGTVTANSTPLDIILGATPQGYAVPDVDQSATIGTITGTHDLVIEKVEMMPTGSYSLGLIWTADGG